MAGGGGKRSAAVAREAVFSALMHHRPFLSVVGVRRIRKESVTEIAFFSDYAKRIFFWMEVGGVAYAVRKICAKDKLNGSVLHMDSDCFPPPKAGKHGEERDRREHHPSIVLRSPPSFEFVMLPTR